MTRNTIIHQDPWAPRAKLTTHIPAVKASENKTHILDPKQVTPEPQANKNPAIVPVHPRGEFLL